MKQLTITKQKLKSKLFWLSGVLIVILLSCTILVAVSSIKLNNSNSKIHDTITNSEKEDNIDKLLSSNTINENRFEKVNLTLNDKFLALKYLTNYLDIIQNDQTNEIIFNSKNINQNLLIFCEILIKQNQFDITNLIINIKYKLEDDHSLLLDIRWTNDICKDKNQNLLYYSLMKITV